MDERERIRQEKLERLREQAQAQEEKEEAKQSKKQEIEALFKQATTSDARQRLNTVKMTKPQLAEEVKKQIVQVKAAGKLSEVIDDAKMRDLLSQAHEQTSTDFDISRR